MSRSLALGLALAWSLVASPSAVEPGGLATAGGRPVKDAVIWLDAPADTPRAVASATAVLEQRNLEFEPHVLAVQVGTRVRFPNVDRVLHNVFSYREGRPFDLGLYPVGEVKDVPFDRPGLSRIFCNIHSQMSAYILVVDTPYFAVSDDAGRFRMKELPAGTYRYHAWRPGEKTILNASVDIRPGGSFTVAWP